VMPLLFFFFFSCVSLVGGFASVVVSAISLALCAYV
jgi:hypothetical protein